MNSPRLPTASRIQKLWITGCALCVLASASGAADPLLDRMVREADAVIREATVENNVTAAAKWKDVAVAAEALQHAGRFKEAVRYFEDATVLAPNELGLRMQLAEAALKAGDETRATRSAKMVWTRAEDADLITRSGEILGQRIEKIAPFESRTSGKPCICVVPLGRVDDWITAAAVRILHETFGLPVVGADAKWEPGAPSRSNAHLLRPVSGAIRPVNLQPPTIRNAPQEATDEQPRPRPGPSPVFGPRVRAGLSRQFGRTGCKRRGLLRRVQEGDWRGVGTGDPWTEVKGGL